MSGIVRPKGRAASAVYWRRRLVLVAVVLLAAAGGIKLVGGNGDEPDTTATSAEQSEDSGKDDGASESKGDTTRKSQPTRDESRARPGRRNVPVRMGNARPCDPAKVSVRVSVAKDTYAGGMVPLRLGLSTDADSPCVLSLDKHAPLLSVSTDSGQIWTSERCSDLFGTDAVRLDPTWTSYLDARWSGRASKQGCGDDAKFAEPGTYTVQAAVLGGEPTKATVQLDERPEPRKSKRKQNNKKKNENQKQHEKRGDGNTDR